LRPAAPETGRLFEVASEALADGRGEPMALPAGAILFRQGEEGDSAYIVLEGELAVSFDIGPLSQPVATIGPRGLVGEIALVCGTPRTATVRAGTDVRLLRLGRAALFQTLAEEPGFGLALIRGLGQRLAETTQPLAFLAIASEALKCDAIEVAALAEAARGGGLGAFADRFEALLREVEQRQSRREELLLAQHIQQALLPRPLALPCPEATIAAVVRPSREVSGDTFDFFLIDPRHLVFLVADVSGKGVPAGLFMTMLHSALRAVAAAPLEPGACLTRVNAILAYNNDTCMFATTFLGVLRLDDGTLTYCNAGHCPPLVHSAAGVRRLASVRQAPLGLGEGRTLVAEHTRLAPGELLLAYTDGVTEATGADGSLYGESRLEALLATLAPATAPAAAIAAVTGAVDAFTEDQDPSDDLTCLALAYHGPVAG